MTVGHPTDGKDVIGPGEKNMKKRIILIMLVLTTTLGACGKKNEDNKNVDAKTVEESTPVITSEIAPVAPVVSDNDTKNGEANNNGKDNNAKSSIRISPTPNISYEENTLLVGGEKYKFTSAEGIENYKSIAKACYLSKEQLETGQITNIALVNGEGELPREEASVIFNFPQGSSAVQIEGLVSRTIALQCDYELDGLTSASNEEDAKKSGYTLATKGNAFFIVTDERGNVDMDAIEKDINDANALSDIWKLEYGKEAEELICTSPEIKKYDYLSIAEICTELAGSGYRAESLFYRQMALAKEIHAVKAGEIESFVYKEFYVMQDGTGFMLVSIYGKPEVVENWFEGLY